MSREHVTDGWYIVTYPDDSDILQRVENGRVDDGNGEFALTLASRGYIFRPVEIIPAEERQRWHDMNATLQAERDKLQADRDTLVNRVAPLTAELGALAAELEAVKSLNNATEAALQRNIADAKQDAIDLERMTKERIEALRIVLNMASNAGHGFFLTPQEEIVQEMLKEMDSQPVQQAQLSLVENVEYRHIIGLLQDASDRIDDNYSDDPEAAKLHKQDLLQAKRWLDKVAQPKDSQPGQQVEALDMPDGAGWWARDGSVSGLVEGEERFTSYFPKFDIVEGDVWYRWGEEGELAIMPLDKWIEIFGGKWWRVYMPWDSQSGQQAQLPDDEQVCDECLGDGELENHSHLAPPIDGDWPMISCWKCNGTGIEQQDAQPSEQEATDET